MSCFACGGSDGFSKRNRKEGRGWGSGGGGGGPPPPPPPPPSRCLPGSTRYVARISVTRIYGRLGSRSLPCRSIAMRSWYVISGLLDESWAGGDGRSVAVDEAASD